MKTLKEFLDQWNESHGDIPPNVLHSNELTFEVVTTGKNQQDAKKEAMRYLVRAKVTPDLVKVKVERNLLVDEEEDDWSWIVRVQGEPEILDMLRKYTDRGIA